MVSSADKLEQIRKWDGMYHEKVHELREHYGSLLPRYQRVRDRAELVLRTKIEECKIRCDVTSRIKDLASVRAKIGLQYSDMRAKYQAAGSDTIKECGESIDDLLKSPISRVRDIVGVRCTGLFSRQLIDRADVSSGWIIDRSQGRGRKPHDLYILENIIRNSFNGAQGGSTAAPAEESFRYADYKGIRYIVSLKDECLVKALEQDLGKVELEIQVRTAAEHSFNEASRYLTYKASESLLGKEEFQREASELLESLKCVQSKLDDLFARSRMVYDGLLYDLTYPERPSSETLERLRDLDVSAGALKLYAIFEFVTSSGKRSKGLFKDLPESFDKAVFDQFWLDEIVRCLARTGRFRKIRDVERIATIGAEGAIDYQTEVQSRLKEETSIFKPKDLTDVLSKCLIFGSEDLHGSYPIRTETLEAAKRYLRKRESGGAGSRSQRADEQQVSVNEEQVQVVQEREERALEDRAVEELARVFDNETTARVLLNQSSFPRQYIPSYVDSNTLWRLVAMKVRDGALPDGIRLIVIEAVKVMPNNPVFLQFLRLSRSSAGPAQDEYQTRDEQREE